MANVYLAEDTTLGRRVAIKVLHQRLVEDPKFVERFRREAKAAAGLNHPNIVAVYDWGQAGEQNYIVMEYVEGETLKDRIRRNGRLGLDEASGIALELLAAIAAAHAKGVIHRDIKSQNILMDAEGRAKVADFGIAQAGDPGMTEAGSILGTAQYLAPEQARGEPVDERSDLYSVGVVLYEMLTGGVPFKGDSAVTVALKHVNELPTEPAERVPGIPYSLNQIVLKALAKDPARRYGSAAEFAADLRAAKTGGPLRAATFDAAAERTQVLATRIAGDQATQVLRRGETVTRAAATRTAASRREPRRRGAPTWLFVLLAAAAIAAVVGGFFLVDRLFGGSALVPNVEGLREAAATAKLTDAGFEVKAHDDYSDEVRLGFVTRQEPQPDIELGKGKTVDIWVCRGTRTIKLESFSGWKAQAVEDWIQDNGLKPERKSGRSDKVEVGEVYRQEPGAGVQVERGSTVTYWVSTGVPRVKVPNVTGLRQVDAAAELTAKGLTVGSAVTENSETVPAGQVIRQDPVADTMVDKGSAVNLVISAGPATPTPTPTPQVDVPNVVTMDEATAKATLEALGLKVKVVPMPGGEPFGSVVDQDPAAGERVDVGSKVIIFVGS
jgi:serine/threonine-protein kinase